MNKHKKINYVVKTKEEGIAMVMSLLMGAVLMTAATGLLIRQITARKLGASESYQQMAEASASNGFNRILAVLNNASTSEYRGYLFTVNNTPGTWEWGSTYDRGEFCAGLSGLPNDPDATGSTSQPWPGSIDGYVINKEETLREDGQGSVQTLYRLRSYSKDFAKGRGTGTFEVEGIVMRTGIKSGDSSINRPLARARLTRSLQLESAIARADDWGVIATQFFNDSGIAKIDGPGRFIWFVDLANIPNCTTNFDNVEGQTPQTVWPIVRDTDSHYIPDPAVYNRDGSVDQDNINGDKINRIWSFDDTNGGLNCNGNKSIVCIRTESAGSEKIPELHTIEENNISTNITSMEYSTFKFQKNSNKKWTIKTARCVDEVDPENNCRSEDKTSNYWQWSKGYLRRDDLSGSAVRQWRYKPSNQAIKQIGICNKANALSCYMQNAWTWTDVQNNTGDNDSKNVIKITASDICTDKRDSNVCHLYIEHINLENTEIFIQNDTRAIVLHLNLGDGITRRNDLVNNYNYKISGESKICGVNYIGSGKPICNLEPAQLVITAENNLQAKSCPDTESSDDLQFSEESIPAAWISMGDGRVRTNNVTTRGVIWSSSLCNDGDLNIKTEDINGTAYVTKGKVYWNFPDNGGIGRRIIRGIRGSGFDIFKRW